MNERAFKHNLKLAIHKSHKQSYHKSYNKCELYGGCLTPAEILALMKAGAKEQAHFSWIPYITEKYNKGECRPVWFYFFPNGIKMKDEL
jgi:hypothetical protein